MSATVQRLLDQARSRLDALRSDQIATQAMPALAHVARALTELSSDGVGNRLASAQQRAANALGTENCVRIVAA